VIPEVYQSRFKLLYANRVTQFVIVTLGDAKEATSTIYKNLNPEWNQTFEMPIMDMSSLVVDAVCWDKDRFGKDYMGEFDVALEEIFADKQTVQEVRKFLLVRLPTIVLISLPATMVSARIKTLREKDWSHYWRNSAAILPLRPIEHFGYIQSDYGQALWPFRQWRSRG
jgi:hypothetical protein